eukprot:TRINITY_DN4301_c0_g1_i2.p1 TRINITY_DN4301_c0_g1~~TRINITY_DN4301_c0_g1_i2.p1  ORF type:complete len:884 (+),score=146.81 TRINITY_DN4301_c0_g1_i2:130-2781(+)
MIFRLLSPPATPLSNVQVLVHAGFVMAQLVELSALFILVNRQSIPSVTPIEAHDYHPDALHRLSMYAFILSMSSMFFFLIYHYLGISLHKRRMCFLVLIGRIATGIWVILPMLSYYNGYRLALIAIFCACHVVEAAFLVVIMLLAEWEVEGPPPYGSQNEDNRLVTESESIWGDDTDGCESAMDRLDRDRQLKERQDQNRDSLRESRRYFIKQLSHEASAYPLLFSLCILLTLYLILYSRPWTPHALGDTCTTALREGFSAFDYGPRNSQGRVVVLVMQGMTHQDLTTLIAEAPLLTSDTITRDYIRYNVTCESPREALPNWVSLVTGAKANLHAHLNHNSSIALDNILNEGKRYSLRRGYIGLPWAPLLHWTQPTLDATSNPFQTNVSQPIAALNILVTSYRESHNPYHFLLAYLETAQGQDRHTLAQTLSELMQTLDNQTTLILTGDAAPSPIPLGMLIYKKKSDIGLLHLYPSVAITVIAPTISMLLGIPVPLASDAAFLDELVSSAALNDVSVAYQDLFYQKRNLGQVLYRQLKMDTLPEQLQPAWETDNINSSVSAQEFYRLNHIQVEAVIHALQRKEFQYRASRNMILHGLMSLLLAVVVLVLFQKFTFVDLVSLVNCSCSQSKDINTKAALWSLLQNLIFWLLVLPSIVFDHAASMYWPLVVTSHILLWRLSCFIFQAVRPSLKRTRWGYCKFLIKALLLFIYMGNNVDDTGSGMMYLIYRYNVLLSVVVLLATYTMSGMYFFLVPTSNVLLDSVFWPDWIPNFKEGVDLTFLAASSSLLVYTFLSLASNSASDFDDRKSTFDKVFLLKLVKDHRNIRSSNTFFALLECCFRRNAVLSHVMLQDVGEGTFKTEVPSIYDAFSAEQKFIVLSDMLED